MNNKVLSEDELKKVSGGELELIQNMHSNNFSCVVCGSKFVSVIKIGVGFDILECDNISCKTRYVRYYDGDVWYKQ